MKETNSTRYKIKEIMKSNSNKNSKKIITSTYKKKYKKITTNLDENYSNTNNKINCTYNNESIKKDKLPKKDFFIFILMVFIVSPSLSFTLLAFIAAYAPFFGTTGALFTLVVISSGIYIFSFLYDMKKNNSKFTKFVNYKWIQFFLTVIPLLCTLLGIGYTLDDSYEKEQKKHNKILECTDYNSNKTFKCTDKTSNNTNGSKKITNLQIINLSTISSLGILVIVNSAFKNKKSN
ncbi:hypothetical protein K4U82_08040 [Staphylococcus epidermidis]|nr:hypothetical protein [Staphylococcus epidermidis]